MSIRYNADEVFEMAEQIERNGGKFYRRAAELASDASTSGMLLELAAMEDDHLKTFAEMRRDLSAKERKAMVFDPDDELNLYLRAMADQHVFDVKADPSARLSAGQAANEVLGIAIGLEKDSIVFYLGLKELVPERFGKERLDGIIQEEFGHISTLSEKMT
jgi:rubrerythrin